ncbi:MAG: hypothetical protein HYT03_00260 [Candidatus Harrisonbacteria bacterium]|nr:hypothetical protein [Candidatus Harrisonbacteria bacterium]
MKKKLLTAILTISIIAGNFIFFTPQAKAIPVIDAPNLAVAIKALGEAILKSLENALLSTLKKRILDVMVDQIITSIQGGGKPQFVTDWRSFLEDAGQAAAGDFARELGAGFLCQPFNFQVQIALLNVPKFSQRAECTLDKIVGNIQAFYDDFRNGGWIAYGTSWQPQNNYFGALLMALQEKEIRTAAATFAAYSEAQTSDGYLSVKKCITTKVPQNDEEIGRIQEAAAAGKDVPPDLCLEFETVTPGSTVKSLVSKAVGSDFDFIVNATSLGDYAAAIVDALINRVFTEGLSLVSGRNSQQTANDATALYNEIIANIFEQNKQALFGNIDGTLVPRQQAQNSINASIQNLNNFKEDLQDLYNEFSQLNKTSCSIDGRIRQVSDIKQEIQSEISKADDEIQSLQQISDVNQEILDPLIAAKNEINTLQSNDAGFARLSTIYGEVSPRLGEEAASDLRDQMTTKQNDLDTYIQTQLDKFNDWLAQCEGPF